MSAPAAPSLASLIHRTMGQASRPPRGYLPPKGFVPKPEAAQGAIPVTPWEGASYQPCSHTMKSSQMEPVPIRSSSCRFRYGRRLGSGKHRRPGSGSSQSRMGIRRENSQLHLTQGCQGRDVRVVLACGGWVPLSAGHWDCAPKSQGYIHTQRQICSAPLPRPGLPLLKPLIC